MFTTTSGVLAHCHFPTGVLNKLPPHHQNTTKCAPSPGPLTASAGAVDGAVYRQSSTSTSGPMQGHRCGVCCIFCPNHTAWNFI
jgi:hypothetical protein